VDGDQSKKPGVNMSYLVSWKTTYQVAVERDHGRLRTHPEVMDFSVEHGYRYPRLLAGNEEPVCQFQTVSTEGFTPQSCAKTVPESNAFNRFELSLSKSRFPDLLETLVVRSNEWSGWSRVVCAQSRRAPFTKNSMNSKGSTLSECVIRREQKKRGCWHKTPA
jgi:hypothetical protein